ncbi:MAG TPA: pitrilysin family protein [Chthoniobacterales bacterium]
MTQYQTTTLANGVRIATREMPQMKSVSVGLWVGVGGRHEPESHCGISHFLEHLLFKGTQRRSSRQITEQVEGLGGFINAFTTEDHTCFYAKAGAQHLPVLADVLCDMYQQSVLAEHEIERERDVIREEILMYRDQPSQFSQELLSEVMWPDHALGRPLTGSVASIGRIGRADLVDYIGRNYNGSTTVITVAGQCVHERVVAEFGPRLEKLAAGSVPDPQPWSEVAPRLSRLSLAPHETEQTHLAIGYHAMSRTDERRHALKLLSVILGENMSSRLFQQLRERYAYCYSIQSGTLVLEDSGLLNICVGLEPRKLRNALRAIGRELQKLRSHAPSRKELRQAQEYTVGQNELSLESTTNQVMWMGESMIAYGTVIDPDQVQTKLKGVTPEMVQEVAQLCFDPDRLGIAVVGRVDRNRLEKWVGEIGF